MKRHVFVGRVKPERIEEYKIRHASVWPEMLQALTKAGFRNYSIHLRPDGFLVGYFEADNAQSAFDAMAATDVNARWQADMAPFFVIPDGKRPDECFEFLEEAFFLP